MSGDAFSIYLRSVNWNHLWHIYVLPLYTATRIAELCCPYVILMASLERYSVVSPYWKSTGVAQRLRDDVFRRFVIAIIICCAIVLRSVCLFEVEIVTATNCSDVLGRLGVSRTPIVQTQAFHVYDW